MSAKSVAEELQEYAGRLEIIVRSLMNNDHPVARTISHEAETLKQNIIYSKPDSLDAITINEFHRTLTILEGRASGLIGQLSGIYT